MKGNQNRFKKREREIMADEIRETMKEINKRVKEIELEEKITGIKSDFVKSQKIIFGQLTKTKNTRKISTGNLSKLNKNTFLAIKRLQKSFLKSKWSTKEGREEIFNKQYETFSATYDVSKEQYKSIVEVLGSENFRNMGDFRPPSEAVMEVYRNNQKASSADVTNAIGKYSTLSQEARNYIGSNVTRNQMMIEFFIANPDIEGNEAFEEAFKYY